MLMLKRLKKFRLKELLLMQKYMIMKKRRRMVGYKRKE